MLPEKRSSNPMKRTTSMRGLSLDVPELQRPTHSEDSPEFPNQDQHFLALSPTSPVSQTSPFLRSCCLCNRRLAPARDIFMYRGNTAFCSERCRAVQMKQDERKRKLNVVGAAKSDKQDLHSSSTSSPEPPSTTEPLVAA
ncbi:hypothetical protein F3Y22_tig00112079pilonHSYRG00022 [Hibiscus syriacus]|uniref:FLZ-type domain-containing protein n=1 Tax=Hibiscus syriacus TaxID=106335 RepID=A0A6A2Y9Q0_HIBSY|nr:protein INCREASED RESISTANCE TO MYZUS PERSICAE 1-like [Hibiscus syriacus]KAE8670809.1 hypothetical protein F3Y22_tig00112079pilonHSYRG00022 [Hibiscus syriacus]